ncbi:MAG TPA: TlpA family protein disulfide reductase [Polyangiaceae bacterium]|nr:TlpA family protein disulfide reductase [Polyangiaceae bacterium]
MFAIGSCASDPNSQAAHPAAASGGPIHFAFGSLDGQVVTSDGTRGRLTALLFVTTYDLPSHVAARRLNDCFRSHVPRFNAASIALESLENAPLVETFRDSLALRYPVALADQQELRASPAFAGIDRVPVLVLLDRSGRERFRHAGLFEAADLESWLRALE